MKRSLPTTTTTTTSSSLSLLSTHRAVVLTLLFLSNNNNNFAIAVTSNDNSNNSNSITNDNFDNEDLFRKKHYDYEKQCRPLLQMALNFDINSSLGLNRDEFSNFWTNGLQSNREDVRSVYDSLLCECHYSFDLGRSCCDDTASEDDDDGGNGVGGSKSSKKEGHWSEISLVQFTDNSPGSWEKHYHKQFCKRVYDVLSWEGIYVNDVDWDVMPITTTTATTTTTTTTTTEAPTTTTTAEVITTEETTTAIATTTKSPPIVTTTEKPATTTEEPTTTTIAPATTEEPDPIVSTPEATTTTASIAEATTAGAIAVADDTTTATAATTAATATIASTTTPTATEPITTTSTSTAITTDSEPPSAEPIVVTFVGSTDGNVDADTASQEFLDEVAHAFWKVSLNVLEDMDIVVDDGDGDDGEEVRDLQWVQKPQQQQREQGQERRGQGGQRRQLISSLGDEFDTYFESMNMHVENVGCPAGLVYAAARTPCIQFKYTLTPLPKGPLTSTPTYSSEFATQVTTATNDDGDLYNTLLETYPDTQIVGMGSPGTGIPYQETSNTNRVVSLESSRTNEAKSVASSGIAVGGLIGIILAFSLFAVLIAAFVLKRHRTKQLARKNEQELNDSNLSEDIEANEVNADASRVESWLDMSDTDVMEREEIEERLRRQTSPASSLAAMGVASTVATRLSTSGNGMGDANEEQWMTKQTERLMRQTSATADTHPSTSSSSLETMRVSNTVATRLTTGDTEVMLSERTPWSKNEPVI